MCLNPGVNPFWAFLPLHQASALEQWDTGYKPWGISFCFYPSLTSNDSLPISGGKRVSNPSEISRKQWLLPGPTDNRIALPRQLKMFAVHEKALGQKTRLCLSPRSSWSYSACLCNGGGVSPVSYFTSNFSCKYPVEACRKVRWWVQISLCMGSKLFHIDTLTHSCMAFKDLLNF